MHLLLDTDTINKEDRKHILIFSTRIHMVKFYIFPFIFWHQKKKKKKEVKKK